MRTCIDKHREYQRSWARQHRRPLTPEQKAAQSKRRAAWYAANQLRLQAASIAWYAGNIQRGREQRAAYYRANKAGAFRRARIASHNRRARISGDRLSPGIVRIRFDEQNGLCGCCYADLQTAGAEIDHVTPLARGGRNVDDNVWLLCMPCNRRKHAKRPLVFFCQMAALC